MRHLSTLRRRILAASLLFGLLVATAFVALIFSVRDARESARSAEQSERVAAAASRLERLLLDLETGQRAYVITGRRSFLEPWERALRTYPQVTADLHALVRDPGQRARVEGIRRDMERYVTEWSQLVIDTVAVSREQAARLVATGEGKQRVDNLRSRFDTFLARQRELSDERSKTAEASADRAVALGLAGLGGSALLLFLFALYLVRSTIVPVEDVAAAARRLREGDRGARVPERAGDDEAAALTRDFNAMAQALAENFDDLARQRAELRAVLDAAVEGVAMAAPDGRFVYTNERMATLCDELGVDAGGSLWECLRGLAALTADPEQYEPALEYLAADAEAFVVEPVELAALGRSFVGYVAPVRGPGGRPTGRIFSLRETTDERAAERAKEQFLATVSHELRTPLTSIVGFTEFVRQGEVGEVTREQDRFLAIVDRSARQLHALVDDLLTVGRTDEGRLDLALEDLDLSLVVADAVEAAAVAADEKKIELTLESVAAPMRGDRRRLTQLAGNLVGNAIKFTPEHGRVDVRVQREPGGVVLEVADTGIGIEAQDQKRLFERFFRAASATEAQVPGTGLGLAICKEIVEAHGGTITVSSATAAGTTFRVQLPEGGQ